MFRTALPVNARLLFFFSKVHSNVDYIETENERQRKKIDQNEKQKKNKTKKNEEKNWQHRKEANKRDVDGK